MLDALLGFAFFLSALGVIVGLILLLFKPRRKLGKFLAIVSGIICVSSLTIAVILLAEPTAERKAKLEKRDAEVARQREEQIAVARQREEQIKREREEQIRR